MKTLRDLLIGLSLLWAVPAFAAVATIYVDTGGCESGSTTLCSGTTDSATASAKGAGSTITCSAVAGPAAAPGCTITGTQGAAGQIAAISVDGSQALFLNCATNTTQKVFFINSVDDAAGAVGTTTTPTGCTAATSNWGIGGRMIYASANFASALRAGDTVQINNTPATKALAYFTSTTAGDSTTGTINLIGKSGVRPVLEVSGNNGVNVLNIANADWYISNLEFKAPTASTVPVITASGANVILDNIKISQAGTAAGSHAISATGGGIKILRSEISSGQDGINWSNAVGIVLGNYIHGVTGDCIEITGAGSNLSIASNVLNACGARGVYISGAATTQGHIIPVLGNTIYGAGSSGLEVADADWNVLLYNNILQENGNASGEFNVKWAAGTAQLVSTHGYNLFYHSNCEGSASSTTCVSGLTANATEVAGSSASFTNAGASDFTLQSTSPAKATGFPGALLGGNTGYLDIGSLQRQESSGGGAPPFFGGL